jgi:tetratricopeptide (TPR) repeat protein
MKKLLLFIFLITSNIYSQKEEELRSVRIISPATTVDETQRAQLRQHIAKLTSNLPSAKDKAFVYRNRAMAYLSLKEYTAAISDWSKVIELDSEDGESFLFRGLCKQLSKKSYSQTSCDDFKKAKELKYEKADWNSIGVDCPE